MQIKFTDEHDSAERFEKIERILPKTTIITQVLEPLIEQKLFKALAKCVRMELEIYREYPKKPRPFPFKEDVKTFDPRNNETCFQGKAFKANHGDLVDSELRRYRRAVGTIPHHIWGDVTLLEIWGGDHFADYKKMVTGAFAYGMGERSVCPKIMFHVNPLFKNKKSGDFRLSQRQREEQEAMDDLMARAIVFGVKTPAEFKISRSRRTL